MFTSKKQKYLQGAMITLALLIITTCGSKDQNKQTKDLVKGQTRKIVNKQAVPKTISIYRYGDFSISKAKRLEKQLKSYFPVVVSKELPLSLPEKYYNKERNRYLGTGLFEELSKHRNGDAVIGLTDYVIFKPNEISQTYGIMGVSPVGTYKCVVSSKIPSSGKEQSDDNFVKLALHELGHAFGLSHCPDQHCYMVDAEHKMKFPQTTEFCKSCKTKLNAKGWTIK
jgi:archaemetzincin